MSFLLGISGALASLFIFFHAASNTATNQANIFLIFVGLFLFLLFAWGIGADLQGRYSTKSRRR